MADLSQNIEVNTSYLMPNLMWEDVTSTKDELMKRVKVTYRNADKVQYDQRDGPFGILSYRGLGASPPVTTFGAFKKYTIDPGYWGGKTFLLENVLTQGRKPSTLGDPIAIEQETNILSWNFNTQIVSLIRKALADTIRLGYFTQVGQNGAQFAYQIANYTSQQLSPGTPWAASAPTAMPVQDMLGYKATLQKGSSNKFGKGSVLLCNSNTMVDIFNTGQIQGSQALHGPYGSSIMGVDGESAATGINKVMQLFDLPDIVLYDYGYYSNLAAVQANDKTQWNYIIPNKCLLWIGEREQGQPVAEFQLTRHAGLIEEGDAKRYPNADDMIEGLDAIKEGLYVRAHYQNFMPHQYSIEVGVNGSPVVGYPNGVAVITYT